MKERHQYAGTPEPGYHKSFDEAVGRYFVEDPNGEVVFQFSQIYREHPELNNYEQHKKLVDSINQTAITIYEYRTSEK